MTSTTSSSSSSPRQLTISSLPDLPLLVILDHLPLLDLFNRIPLVCPRWTQMQPVALARRTRLVLRYSNLYKYKDVNPLDTLPLPLTYHGWTTGTGGQLLRPQAVEWLWAKLPNITELTLVVCFLLKGHYNRVVEAIAEQVIRLIIAGRRWCSRLTSLQLSMSNFGTYLPTISRLIDLTDDLIEAINHRMPRLTVLNLAQLPNKPSVLLTREALARLRHLEIYEHHQWLWLSLCSVLASANPLRSDLRIHFGELNYPSRLVQRPHWPRVYEHVHSMSCSVSSYEGELCLALDLIPSRFQALRALRLNAASSIDDPVLVLSTALRRLSPLTSLVELHLSYFQLLPVVVEHDGDGHVTKVVPVDAQSMLPPVQPVQVAVLPSLEVLDLFEFGLFSHTDLARSLHWPSWLPRLQWLSLARRAHRPLYCNLCHPARGGGGDNDDWSSQRYMAPFFATAECRRLAVEPLQACPQLGTISFDRSYDDVRNWDPENDHHSDQHLRPIATRADLCAPFEWSDSVSTTK